jgi:hypothetical protein
MDSVPNSLFSQPLTLASCYSCCTGLGRFSARVVSFKKIKNPIMEKISQEITLSVIFLNKN